MQTQEELRSLADAIVDSACGCSDHPCDFKMEEVDEVLRARTWCYCELRGDPPCGSYCDTGGAALVRLKPVGGKIRWAVAAESSDTSGHGCQCDGSAIRYGSFTDALRLGLTEEEARMLDLVEERRTAVEAAAQR